MTNTSMGYHTFSFFQKLKEEDYFSLSNSFISYAQKNSNIKRFPVQNKAGNDIGWCYSYTPSKGIRWLLISSAVNEYDIRGLLVIIDSKVLVEGNYIAASQESDYDLVEKLFNEEAAKI